ncbi:MAG: 2-oxo acid dehydrogenase subunit E2 [Chitinophagales bacterium]|jgi:2-oxoglutarate dehydrogenase E2 component (dihydrolipoamide succinyltransferase)|nr:2-oxo acid dehydrogenase subunit E2 [Chitinophagales bacterium]
MITFLTLPKLGESIQEGTISRWLVKPGDEIQKNQIFVEISTDKVESELPSIYHCRIEKLLYQEGDVVPVGASIAEVTLLSGTVEQSSAPLQEPSNQKPQTTDIPPKSIRAQFSSPISPQVPQNSFNELKLSPLVRSIIVKHKLTVDDLAYIKPTGYQGRISHQDIQNYITQKDKIQSSNTDLHFQRDFLFPKEKQGFKPNELVEEAGDNLMKFDKMRQLIAQNLLRSVHLSAHCTTVIDIEIDALIEFRETNKAKFESKYGTKLTLTHLFMMLVRNSLRAFPKLNAHQSQDTILLKEDLNLGFAALISGDNLIVPNIKKAQHMDLPTLAKTMNELAAKAKDNKLQVQDTQNGTFTLSNTGIFGSKMGTPIIVQPQTAIMSLGAIQRTPVVHTNLGKESISIASVLHASLSYDHRVIDGAYASKFLSDFKANIQNFKIEENSDFHI